MVSYVMWKIWPLVLSNDENLGLRPRSLSTVSHGACFSQGISDHDQIRMGNPDQILQQKNKYVSLYFTDIISIATINRCGSQQEHNNNPGKNQ